ncbi:MAG: TOBE domain-containing protein, partial [Solirubrobacteraceae bacterium]
LVERTVYVGATVQVMVRLATGAQLQASIANTGDADSYQHGMAVAVHIPADALRILGGGAEPDGAANDAATEPAPAPA